jgi:SAM-dependent methyltransferase
MRGQLAREKQMTIEHTLPFVAAPRKSESTLEAQIQYTNRAFEEAGRYRWSDSAGPQVASRVLKLFMETAGALEACGWPAVKIKESLKAARNECATSWFMRRCQEWPRGYAGDFETIEYLVAGANRSVPGTLGWHIENILLESPVVEQHRNKLDLQSQEITRALMRNQAAHMLSIGCGGCLDWVPILPHLTEFEGEIVLNDIEPAALELAGRRMRTATRHFRLAPGNVIRIARRLADRPQFDLVLAGGLFDYLPHRATVLLLRTITQDLLVPGGVLLFTNIADGNPWRLLMEYGSDWPLIERSSDCIQETCREAGIPRSSISLKREGTGLTWITRILR